MINYISAATSLDLAASFLAFSDVFTYETLIWQSSLIPKATLETTWLAMEKTRISRELSIAMQAELIGGFLADVLTPGVYRKYDSSLQGQIAVIGAMVFTTPNPNPPGGIVIPTSYTLGSIDPTTGQQSFDAHTYLQLVLLFSTLGGFAASLVSKLQTKLAAVMSENTGDVEADLVTINNITWTS